MLIQGVLGHQQRASWQPNRRGRVADGDQGDAAGLLPCHLCAGRRPRHRLQAARLLGGAAGPGPGLCAAAAAGPAEAGEVCGGGRRERRLALARGPGRPSEGHQDRRGAQALALAGEVWC